MRRIILACALAGILSVPAKADETAIVGTWQITSHSLEWLDTTEIAHPFTRPTGYLQYSPGGHFVVFLADGDLRQPVTAARYTDAEQLDFYNGIIAAYTGNYTIDGNKMIHHVLTAWRPTWVGTDQIRYFKIDGKT